VGLYFLPQPGAFSRVGGREIEIDERTQTNGNFQGQQRKYRKPRLSAATNASDAHLRGNALM
jgi:hypothetical protein